jgi:hypothetical protein
MGKKINLMGEKLFAFLNPSVFNSSFRTPETLFFLVATSLPKPVASILQEILASHKDIPIRVCK